jgi:hypothetical protein
MSDEFRQVFSFELKPGHFVSINMRGPFDSDMWQVLNDFVKRHETKPRMFTQEHHYLQGEHMWVFHQGCGCPRCYTEYERIVDQQKSQANPQGESK